MAKTINSKKKLCKVMTNGPIAELGFISGPITSPCRIDLRKVINMVQRGMKVYEINPKNYAEEVLLTIKNVNSNNFPEPEAVKFPVEEKKVEPEVVKKDQIEEAIQENIIPETAAADPIAKAVEAATVATETPVVETAEAPKPEFKIDTTPKENSGKNKYKNDFTKNK